MIQGSGKTLAYALPILHKLLQEQTSIIKKAKQGLNRKEGFEALIVTPTRELAVQVIDHIKAVIKMCGTIRLASVIGGMAAPKQRRLLSRQPNIIVATPGRLWDLINEVCFFLYIDP
jgi:ATP-dependent RNA helicase DDX24/MAK5